MPRAHHAAALLLPDARVLMAGGDHYMIYLGQPYAAENESAQIFSPPYLYDPITQALAARPLITSVDGPASCDYPGNKIITYGQNFTVDFTPPGATILEVNLIALGHASHSYDQHQRFVDLTDDFSWSSGVLTVTPPTAAEAPPGYYMLFILDDSGVPSKAEIIRLHPSCLAEPTVNAPLATTEPLKNRYVSFKPNNTGEFAFQLELTDSSLFPDSVGEKWWVSKPALKDGVYVSSLSASLEYREWTEDLIHVGGCPVVPDATYDLRALSYGGEYSAPVALSTVPEPTDGKKWGDAVSSYDGVEWGPPQGTVNFDDVFAAIQGFTHSNITPPLPRVDIEPERPNRVANFNDVAHFILAWKSEPYPFGAPEFCYPCVVEVDIIGDPITFTLIADSPFIDPGEGVEIEVYVDSIPDLGGYQVTLEVLGGTSGTLVLTDVTVDTAHPDYVFAGLSDIPMPDIPRGRVGNGLIGAESGVSVSGSGYLATFSYIPSELATGDFHVEVVVGHDDTSPVDSTVTRLNYNGGSCTVIGVGIDCYVDADCDDGNDCTIDTCVNNACILTDAASGTACDDGLFCTTTGQCDGSGTCVGSGSPCPPKFPVCCELTDTCVADGIPCTAPI